MAGLLVAAVPAAHAAAKAGALATPVTAPSTAPITASTTAADARARVRLQHAPTSFVHLPSPRTSAGPGMEQRRVRMYGAPLRRCAA